MKSAIFYSASLLLIACGGKGTVDLGANGASRGWADTRSSGVAGASAVPNPAVPQTLYDGGETVLAIAVDGDTFAAMIDELSLDAACRTRIDVCDVRDCKGTIETIHTDSYCGVGLDSDLIISHGEILWSELAVDSTHADRIMACPIRDCNDRPKQVVLGSRTGYSTLVRGTFSADADYVYWIERRDTFEGVARYPRVGSVASEFKAFSPEIASMVEDHTGPTRMLSDEANRMIYVQRGRTIARMASDLATDPSVFYQDSMPLGEMALVGGYLYFTVSSLIGGIRRCPTSGCDQGSELVVDAPHWPSNFVADDKAMYWMHKADSGRTSPSSGNEFGDSDSAAISTSLIDGSNGTRLLVPTFQVYTHGTGRWAFGPVMNTQHIYWCDVTAMKGSFFPRSIRMMAR
ncbi:MAG TPA: hypothetical protein VIV60_33940 [Polyangiaceae bacterium]